MPQEQNRRWILASRPDGLVDDSTFTLEHSPLPVPAAGEFLVRNLYLSFDPTQRGWINDRPSYVEPVRIGEVMRAFALGQVIESNHPEFKAGDLVLGLFGWQDYCVDDGGGFSPARKLPSGIPPTHALSIYGVTGLTAYFGMLEIGQPKPNDTVVVSAAAGATGSVAGQIAKIKGCRVIGIAGGPAKCAWLTDAAGFDAAIDYKNDDVDARLDEHCPDGVNVYFDNVGGAILESLLNHLALGARVVLCGGMSTGYGVERPPGPKNYLQLLVRRARMEGFIVLDFAERFPEAIQALAGWLSEGKIVFQEDVQEGLEMAPDTLNRLFTGKNRGKQLLKIADPPLPT